MGNVHLPADQGAKLSAKSIQDEDDGFDSDMNSDMILLLEENARLRALVIQLSSLVLKHVVDRRVLVDTRDDGHDPIQNGQLHASIRSNRDATIRPQLVVGLMLSCAPERAKRRKHFGVGEVRIPPAGIRQHEYA